MGKEDVARLLTDEVTKHYSEIITAKIRKYFRGVGASSYLYQKFDDYFQTCFMWICDYISKKGELPPDYKIWLKVEDILKDGARKAEREKDAVNISYDEQGAHDHSTIGLDDRDLERIQNRIYGAVEDEDIDKFVDSLVNQFEKGSNERIWLEYFLESAKLRDFGYHPPKYKPNAPTKKAKKEGYTDEYLSTLLTGIEGTGSAFRKLKKRMIKFLEDELGISNYLRKDKDHI